MMIKMLIQLFLISLFVFFSCENTTNNRDIRNMESSFMQENTLNGKIRNKAFAELVSYFKYQELPVSSLVNDDFEVVFDISTLTLEERYSKAIMPLDTVVKYFCGGLREQNNQPSGGIYEYYYGYRFKSSGDYVLLFYFRPSDDTYCFRIATFDYDGILIDDVGIGGQKFEEAYKWFEIGEDLSIHTEEILCDMGTYIENVGVEVLRTDREYKITSTGKIELVKEIKLGQMTYIENEELRLVKKNEN